MQVYRRPASLREAVNNLRNKAQSLGFVPTMGALHQGHLALIERALTENEQTVLSIFVNPTQFNAQEDLQAYPRQLEEDIQRVSHWPNLLVFHPEVEDLYGREVQAQNYPLGGIAEPLEGAHRPGHFQGVATVVHKLLSVVQPQRAYFGEKDFQQLRVIQKLVAQLELPVKVIGCPIVREPSGLAMSSRNMRLSPKEKDKAAQIYQGLMWAATHWARLGPAELEAAVQRHLQKHDLEVEYVAVADEENLQRINKWSSAHHARCFVAVWCGDVRLIDNERLF